MATITTEAEALAAMFNLVDQFRQTNQRIISLENDVRNSPDLARTIGRDVISARNQYTDSLSKFLTAYLAVTGGPTPDGLQIGPAAALGFAALFAGLIYALYTLNNYINGINTTRQVALTQANTQAQVTQQVISLQQLYTDAVARGDNEKAAYYLAAINALKAGLPSDNNYAGSTSTWLTDNWISISMIVAGVLLLPRVVEG